MEMLKSFVSCASIDIEVSTFADKVNPYSYQCHSFHDVSFPEIFKLMQWKCDNKVTLDICNTRV